MLSFFYSPRDIAAFRFQGIGKTILYVFLLTLLSVTPISYYFGKTIFEGITAISNTIKDELPPFTIENGKLYSDKKTPVTINDDEITIIFDSTGTIDRKTLENTDHAIALLQNEFLFITAGQIQATSYSMFSNTTISKDDLEGFITSLDSVLPIVISILVLIIFLFASGIKFIEVSILALIGLLLKNMTESPLQYRHTWRMAAYSITIPTTFFTIMTFLKTPIPNGFLINWLVSTTILYLAIKEVPKRKKSITNH
ncbi:DUF1189 domain-containing protein [Bacillus aquiflavi]|uniref:DUF1189 domain-containing protein n=1 Tax=Bacillus aquiflavi TaxID=2672567 RepID=UPI001CA80CC5|nr:DUF1189 domain-containing protein [Bacillus aquiflavi]UAC47264.1 DUF1189 domain-containing protein [Bacillus aquiflavi]